ncbi:MAG: class I SAM-dependent methyltransferase, partial [Clostridia bacterium]|nr:class I SAM-dependent methyltransferase [Clostridia bacterium]
GLSAEILHQRAEEAGRMPAYREQFDLVTARAVAALRELCEYCLPFVKIGGTFAAMKSVRSDEEIVQAQKAMHLLGGQIESVETCTLPYAGERTLILIKKCSQTPSKYPRPSAKIAKQPLI